MKKTLIVLAIAGVAVLALGIAGYAYAQTQVPSPFTGYGPRMMEDGYGPGMMGEGYGPGMMGQGYGYGRMGEGYGYGMMGEGYGYGMMGEGYGPGMMGGEMDALHEIMYPAMAAALGLSPEEFDARHSAGETFWDIAEAQGLTTDEAWSLMQTARDAALDQAVDDGDVSREFADGMRLHMDGMLDGDFAPGSGHCDR